MNTHLHTLIKLQASVSAAHTQLQTSLAELDSFLTTNKEQIEQDSPSEFNPVLDDFLNFPKRIQNAQRGDDTLSVIEAISRLILHLSGGRT
jgi:hypothetical protein